MEGGSCERQGRDGAGRCPGDSGRFAGAASLGRRRPARGQPAGRAEGERRAGEAERDGADELPQRQVSAPRPQGSGGRPRRPGSRIPSFAVQPPPRHLPAPSRLARLPERGWGRRVRASGAGGASRPARRRPQPHAGPLCAARPRGRRSLPEAWSRAAAGAAPRPAALPVAEARPVAPARPHRLLFPARVDRSRLRLPSAVPSRPRPALVTAAARSRRRDPRRGGRRVSSSRRGRGRNFASRARAAGEVHRGEPRAGTPRARRSLARPAGPAEGEDDGAPAPRASRWVCAPGGGRGCALPASPAARGEAGDRVPLPGLPEGPARRPARQVLTPGPPGSQLRVVWGSRFPSLLGRYRATPLIDV